LTGFEVKAVREGKVSFDGSFVQLVGNKPLLVNFYIGRYSHQSQEHDEGKARVSRQLLLNRREIGKIAKELEQKGKSAIPLALILDKNMIKLEMALVRGLKKFDKKNVEKDKQIRRDMEIEAKTLVRR
jgi:SsrA-binding protein